MANVRPLHDRVLIRRIEEAEQKVGGIIIPDTAKEKPLQAEVIAVGSGRMLDTGKKVALTLEPGDKVLIGKWSGTEVKIDGEELLILKEDEVLGVYAHARRPRAGVAGSRPAGGLCSGGARHLRRGHRSRAGTRGIGEYSLRIETTFDGPAA